MKIYKCNKTGKLFLPLDKNANFDNNEISEIMANSVDAAMEKHIPVIKIVGNNVEVCVGSTPHPMLAEHNITWVALETNYGVYFHYLDVNNSPTTTFVITNGENVKTVYAYCNLHGLWKFDF